MLIRIAPSSGIPITRQIVDQIRSRCASGALKSGDRLPSVRELARELAVNQNTILRAYERLTAEGLLELRHGEGTFVADFAAKRHLRREQEAVIDEMQRLTRKARMLGFTAEQLHDVLADSLEGLDAAELASQGPQKRRDDARD